MIDQSYSERQLFEKAYERFLSEFNIVLGNSEETQKKLDKALKRNLEAQKVKKKKEKLKIITLSLKKLMMFLLITRT